MQKLQSVSSCHPHDSLQCCKDKRAAGHTRGGRGLIQGAKRKTHAIILPDGLGERPSPRKRVLGTWADGVECSMALLLLLPPAFAPHSQGFSTIASSMIQERKEEKSLPSPAGGGPRPIGVPAETSPHQFPCFPDPCRAELQRSIRALSGASGHTLSSGHALSLALALPPSSLLTLPRASMAVE